MPAKGKKKLVFDVPPEEHEEFMARATAARMSAIDYFRSMRAPLPIFHQDTRVGEEREKYIRFAVFSLELMYKSNGGQRTSQMGLEQEWNSRLDKIEDCIRALRTLPMPGTQDDTEEVAIPSNPSWIKGRGELLKFAAPKPAGDQE